MRYVLHDSPLGALMLAGTDETLAVLRWNGATPDEGWRHDADALPAARRQLDAYFAHARTAFDLPLAPHGTPFQRRVWHALQAVPAGQVVSYAHIAAAVCQPKGTQAVGQANGANPIPIVIPCHRVVAADGGIGGFSGPDAYKRALLEREGVTFVDTTPRLI